MQQVSSGRCSSTRNLTPQRVASSKCRSVSAGREKTYASIHSSPPSALASRIRSPQTKLQVGCSRQVSARSPKSGATLNMHPEDQSKSPPASRQMRTPVSQGRENRVAPAPKRATSGQGNSEAPGLVCNKVQQTETTRQKAAAASSGGLNSLISDSDSSSDCTHGSTIKAFRNALRRAGGIDEDCRRDLLHFLEACEASGGNAMESNQNPEGCIGKAQESRGIATEPPVSASTLEDVSQAGLEYHGSRTESKPVSNDDTSQWKLKELTSDCNPMELDGTLMESMGKPSGVDACSEESQVAWMPSKSPVSLNESNVEQHRSPLPQGKVPQGVVEAESPLAMERNSEVASPSKLQESHRIDVEHQKSPLPHGKVQQGTAEMESPLKLLAPASSFSFSSPCVGVYTRGPGISSDTGPKLKNLPPLPTPTDTPVRQIHPCSDGTSDFSAQLSLGFVSSIGSPSIPSDSFSLSSGARTLAEAREQFKASVGGPERSAEFSNSVLARLEMACGDLGDLMAVTEGPCSGLSHCQ